MPGEEVLKLSDAFMTSVNHPELELECTVININEGRSREFMEKCPVLWEYSIFVGKIRRFRKVMSLKEAIDKAIDECIKEHIFAKALTLLRSGECKTVSELVAHEIDQDIAELAISFG